MRKHFIFLLLFIFALSNSLLLTGCGNIGKQESYNKNNEVGTYSLFKVQERGKEVLYRINTKTGQVWFYDEIIILSSKDIEVTGKQKETLDKLIEDTKKQGKNVYTLPYWVLTSEERPSYYAIE